MPLWIPGRLLPQAASTCHARLPSLAIGVNERYRQHPAPGRAPVKREGEITRGHHVRYAPPPRPARGTTGKAIVKSPYPAPSAARRRVRPTPATPASLGPRLPARDRATHPATAPTQRTAYPAPGTRHKSDRIRGNGDLRDASSPAHHAPTPHLAAQQAAHGTRHAAPQRNRRDRRDSRGDNATHHATSRPTADTDAAATAARRALPLRGGTHNAPPEPPRRGPVDAREGGSVARSWRNSSNRYRTHGQVMPLDAPKGDQMPVLGEPETCGRLSASHTAGYSRR